MLSHPSWKVTSCISVCWGGGGKCESRRRNKLSLVERRRDGSDEKMEEPLQQQHAAQNTANPARSQSVLADGFVANQARPIHAIWLIRDKWKCWYHAIFIQRHTNIQTNRHTYYEVLSCVHCLSHMNHTECHHPLCLFTVITYCDPGQRFLGKFSLH